jgi:hypothetical protein
VDKSVIHFACADGEPVSRHRHQRSGALDFDAFLLSADEDDQRAHSDQENKSTTIQVRLIIKDAPFMPVSADTHNN